MMTNGLSSPVDPDPTLTLVQLPDELLDAIVLNITAPADAISFGLTCNRIYKIVGASPVWRRYCIQTWRNWEPQHALAEKLAQPPLQVDWRQLFIERARIDRQAMDLFSALLFTQSDRAQRMHQVAVKGHDVQDLLLRLRDETPDEVDDVLARRWHANAILGMMFRARAIRFWTRLQRGEEVSLEEVLGAHDLFVLGGQRAGVFDEIGRELDFIAQRIRKRTAEFDNLTIRQRAVCVAAFLRSEGLVGMADEENYHALRNNFLSMALVGEEDHSSLPLQSVAIYCAVSQRLGINARPANFPQHVHAVIEAPPNLTLDGEFKLEAASNDPELMYVDPWRQVNEVPEHQLRQRLLTLGFSPNEHAQFLGAAGTTEIALRVARNMLMSVRMHDNSSDQTGQLECLDVETAKYSALWSMLVLGDGNPAIAMQRRRQCLHLFLEQFQTHFPEDLILFEGTVLPMLEGLPEHWPVLDLIENLRAADRNREVKPRGAGTAAVQYQIGHYFRHRCYGYRGFLVGWDAQCAAGPRWIEQMRVDDLPRGREQPFYNIVADDRSSRYVAEENIEVLLERPPQSLLWLAGQYFKRWDEDQGRFVSNIRDVYPDD